MASFHKECIPCVMQRHQDWCIPASIENALRYLNVRLPLRQEDIRSTVADPRQVSFGGYREALESDPRFINFSFEHWTPPSDDPPACRLKVIQAIAAGWLVLLSIPSGPIDVAHLSVCPVRRGGTARMGSSAWMGQLVVARSVRPNRLWRRW